MLPFLASNSAVAPCQSHLTTHEPYSDAYRASEQGPQFMVVDAAGRNHADSKLVRDALSRRDVVGTPLANDLFAMVDAILEQDDRIAELARPTIE